MDYLNYKIKIDVNAITNVDQIWFRSHYTKLANLCGWLYQRSMCNVVMLVVHTSVTIALSPDTGQGSSCYL